MYINNKIKICEEINYNKFYDGSYYFEFRPEISRLDGPAITYSRLDGPAITCVIGGLNKIQKFYWVNGIFSKNLEFAEKTNHLICNICSDFCNQQCF